MAISPKPFIDSPIAQSEGTALGDITKAVFLFGPWSPSVREDPTNAGLAEVLQRLRNYAAQTLENAYASSTTLHEKSREAILQSDHPLEFQLRTLALQLFHVKRLERAGLFPTAVVGYCFGEFAASVACGYISERAVVDIITRRALALQECRGTANQTDDVAGAMLNVFTTSSVVRRHLSLLQSPVAELAILAGPSHTVLSGTVTTIKTAQKIFQDAGVKCVRVDTSTPFHSRLMDEPLQLLSTLLPAKFDRVTDVAPSEHSPKYISGLTGRILTGQGVGPKYWLRHMREPVRFLECLEFVRDTYCNSPDVNANVALVDIGPGTMLKGIVGRFGWDNVKLVAVEEKAGAKGAKNILVKSTQPLPNENSATAAAKPVPPLPPANILSNSLPSSNNHDLAIPIQSKSSKSRETLFLNILTEMFGFDSDPELLQETVQDIGLNSMDYIRLSTELQTHLGVSFPPNAYLSNATIAELLQILEPLPIPTISAIPPVQPETAATLTMEESDTVIAVAQASLGNLSTVDAFPNQSTNREGTLLGILADMFGYDSDPELLRGSFQDIGLNSMDFIRLSGELQNKLGISFPSTAYTSDQNIAELLPYLEPRPELTESPTEQLAVSTDLPQNRDNLPVSSLPETASTPSSTNPETIFLNLLTEQFGYDSDPEILHETFQDIGLNSMDFIRLSSEFQEQTGLLLPPSVYASNEGIGILLRGLL